MMQFFNLFLTFLSCYAIKADDEYDQEIKPSSTDHKSSCADDSAVKDYLEIKHVPQNFPKTTKAVQVK